MKPIRNLAILMTIVFLTTGCEANYKLNIVDNKFNEEITGISYDSTTWSNEDEFGDSLLNQFQSNYNINDPILYDSDIPSESNEKVKGIKYYEKGFINDSNKLELKAKAEFTLEEFPNSLSMKSLFPEFTIKDRAGVVEIDTGKLFYGFYYYPYLDSIKVTVTTNHVINDSNASETKNRENIWYLNKDSVDENNYMKNKITFSYLKNKTIDSKSTTMTTVIIVIILAILSIIVIILARSRIKANNR